MESDLALAQRLDREAFAHERPFYFLYGMLALVRPSAPGKTGEHEVITSVGVPEDGPIEAREALPALDFDSDATGAQLPEQREGPPAPHLFAVRKVGALFESMVTIGRTQNNDIVIADRKVSRFHAFMKVHADRVELGDSGSRNGTFVAGKRLQKGMLTILIPGDAIKIAHLELEFLDPAGAWTRANGR